VKYRQRDIVTVNFPLAGGAKEHPALIISNADVFEEEEFYIALMLSSRQQPDRLAFTLTPAMCNFTATKTSFVKLQLIERFSEWEIFNRWGSIKQDVFEKIIRAMNEAVFSIKL
jgi:mRNA-degrading endonuclease toxin of MazEF toxin-antitoxin module